MSDQDKTREELIEELLNIRQENHALKAFYENEIAKFRGYFELPLVGIAITSPEKGWIEANQGIRDMLGYSMEELSGLTWADLTHPDDLAADEEQFNRVLSDQQDTYSVEKRFIRKNGDIIWGSLSVGCVRKPDRSVDYIVVILQNITERKQLEKELKRSEIELKRAQEITHIGSFSIDLANNEVYWTEELYKMYGFDPKLPPPLLNESQTLFTSESWELLSTSIANTIKTGIPYEIELITQKKDGSNGWMWARGEPVVDDEGKITKIWGAVQDITDQKQAAEAMRLSEEKFRSLYDNMSEGSALHTLVYNEQGEPEDYLIVEVNPAFEKELGISKELVIHKTSRVAYGVDDAPYFEIFSRVAMTGNPEVFETYFPPLDKHFQISVYSPQKGSFATIFKNITERKKTEQDLHIILAKYKVLYEILPIGLTISDASGKIIESNQLAESILGISRDEQEKLKIDAQEWRIIRPDGTPMPAAEFASVRALETGRPVTNVEMGIVKPNNQVIWINVSAIPIPIEGYGVAIVYDDITGRKLLEIEDYRMQKLLEDSQRIGKIGGWEFNIETRELKWTREMYDIHELDSTFNLNVDQRVNFYTPESLQVVDSAVKNAIEQGEPFEIDAEIITAKGNHRSIKTIGEADLKNRRIFGLFQDITERKLAEHALKESEKKYRNLFEKAQIGMFRTRMDGSKVIDVNDKLLQTFGYTYEEMISNSSTIRYAIPEQRDELIKLIRLNGSVENFEAQMIKKDHTTFTTMMSVISYPEEGILEGSFVDITNRKQAEEALKKSEIKLRELNATKDKFFSIVAHDLKSPFNAILGFSKMLKEEARYLDVESIVKYADSIHSSARQTFRLLENLLEWSRMNQGSIPFEPKSLLINYLIKNEIESLKFSADQKNIALVNSTATEIIIHADEEMITTVIRNLISNAIKFTPKNGSVYIEALRHEDVVEISVSDTGVGMNEETISKLFKIETNFTSRGTENEKGTGLGLLLCKEFVDRHGGVILVESEEGKGSTFKFSIPIVKAG